MYSVIMPLYNKSKTVKESIASILNQTVQDFEVVVVDDGSTDGSADVVKSLSDERIRLHQKKNEGVSVARNYGIDKAKGKYVCFLDADDLWTNDHLQVLTELIEAVPNAGIYATRFRQENSDGSFYSPDFGSERILIVDDIFKRELIQRSLLHTNSICMQKEIIREADGFVAGERIGEDTSLWYRVAAFHTVALINKETTIYRMEYSDVISTSGFMNRQWSFLTYYDSTIKDSDWISFEKKKSIARFINRYRHSLVRHALLSGNRKEATEEFCKVDFTLSSHKEFSITLACFFLPHSLLVKLYKNRG